jgi:hypothetical protein
MGEKPTGKLKRRSWFVKRLPNFFAQGRVCGGTSRLFLDPLPMAPALLTLPGDILVGVSQTRPQKEEATWERNPSTTSASPANC